jgi:hypothetical protein
MTRKFQGNSSPSDYHLLPEVKQNLDGQVFRDDLRANTVATQRPITGIRTSPTYNRNVRPTIRQMCQLRLRVYRK